MTNHDAVHKLSQAVVDIHLAELELDGLDKYMTDEHYATRKTRALTFLKSAKHIMTHVIDSDIGKAVLYEQVS